MNINELLYSNQIAQAKRLAKDKKQKQKYQQTVLKDNTQDSNDVPEELADVASTLEEDKAIEEDNRRNGIERRKYQQERGRYVESRLKKNRRYKKGVSLVI